MTEMNKCYSEMMQFETFLERFRYLKLDGQVGSETFGCDRYLNQMLYKSLEWKSLRRTIILRDNGCDLGTAGFEIHGNILIHHINPITIDDILKRNPLIFDPENLISTVLRTHNAIHYSDESLLDIAPIERTLNDTCPWKRR